MERIEEFKSINLLKLVCSVLIVSYHVQPWQLLDGMTSLITSAISNIGVVFFFLVSGFVLGEKSKIADFPSIILNQIKRISLMWMVWECVYIPFMFFGGGYYKNALGTIIKNVIVGSYGHLWYLRATIVGLLIIYCFMKHNNSRMINILSFLCFCVGIYGMNIYHNGSVSIIDSINEIYPVFRNGFFFGFPCLVIGITISRIRVFFLHISNSILAILTAISMIFYIIEYKYFNGQLTAMLVVFMSLLLILLSRIGNKSHFSTKNIRRLSSLIYLLHYAVFCVVSHFVRAGFVINAIAQFFIVVITTILLSVCVLFLNRRFEIINKVI